MDGDVGFTIDDGWVPLYERWLSQYSQNQRQHDHYEDVELLLVHVSTNRWVAYCHCRKHVVSPGNEKLDAESTKNALSDGFTALRNFVDSLQEPSPTYVYDYHEKPDDVHCCFAPPKNAFATNQSACDGEHRHSNIPQIVQYQAWLTLRPGHWNPFVPTLLVRHESLWRSSSYLRNEHGVAPYLFAFRPLDAYALSRNVYGYRGWEDYAYRMYCRDAHQWILVVQEFDNGSWALHGLDSIAGVLRITRYSRFRRNPVEEEDRCWQVAPGEAITWFWHQCQAVYVAHVPYAIAKVARSSPSSCWRVVPL